MPSGNLTGKVVGGAGHAWDISQLVALRVTAVLNLAPRACADASAKYAASGIAYLALDAEDQPGVPLLAEHFPAAHDFLSRAHAEGGLCLVHCYAGVNRSAAIALAHIMVLTKEPIESVVRRCFELRPWVLSRRRRDDASVAST